MQQTTVPLISICRQAGISQATAKRFLEKHNPMRASGGHYRFAPEEVPEVLNVIASKRKRKRRNVFNSVFCDEVESNA